ncbi:MAG: 4Fe-4S binding protein [Clostridia bacterium]|nr:4Fe-4S binding protein [Clostridia bacterium]MBR3487109.1 4Fe-4S binding protein [Clostridia bacterium]
MWFALTNSFMIGWIKGTIYQGPIKYMCVPGMNCYSCPGAFGSCPIGALQAILDEFDWKKSYVSQSGTYVQAPLYWVAVYVIGILMVIGALCGRLVCGLLCPFGWVQDLLYKIPVKKIKLPRNEASINRAAHPGFVRFLLGLDRYLRYAKYAFLIVMVIFLPLMVKANPWFCKYVCPSGMLLGGIPLMSMDKGLADAAGTLTVLKCSILTFIVVLSVFLYRPFCRYICPLGAIYSLFNKVSLYRYGIDDTACNRCKGCSACAKVCPMGVDPVKDPNSPECIRCGTCAASCPQKAIRPGFKLKTAEGRAIRVSKRK